MAVSRKKGINLVAIVFALVGVVKFLNGGGWIVWFILAGLFVAMANSKALGGGVSE